MRGCVRIFAGRGRDDDEARRAAPPIAPPILAPALLGFDAADKLSELLVESVVVEPVVEA